MTIAHRSDAFRARPDFRARVAENAKIEVVPYATVAAIEGGSRVERSSRAEDVCRGIRLPARMLPSTTRT